MEALSPKARAALRRYHDAAGLTPPTRDRVWQDIEASLAAGVTVDEAPPAPPPRRARVAIAAVIATLAAALLIAVCDPRMRPGEAARRGDGAAVHAAKPGDSQAATRRAPAPGMSTAAIDEPPPAPPRPRRPARSGADDLAAEIALLRQARVALDAGDPASALRIADEHAREFTSGQMQEDRLRLRIEALCALGRGEQARAEADAFLQAYPGSSHAARVRNLCRDDRPTL